MKYLENSKFLAITSALKRANLGDRIVHGRIEAYSCKSVKSEKVLSKEIEKSLVVEQAASSKDNKGVNSPLGPLNSTSTTRLLVNLITTLNASFPDYDFSNLRPGQFDHEPNLYYVQNNINSLLLDGVEHLSSGFKANFWKVLDEAIELDKCEIYSYSPDAESDLGAGKLWAFNYFFYNKKQKKIVFFTAHAISKIRKKDTADTDEIDADENEDENENDSANQMLDWDDVAILDQELGEPSSLTQSTSTFPLNSSSLLNTPTTIAFSLPSPMFSAFANSQNMSSFTLSSSSSYSSASASSFPSLPGPLLKSDQSVPTSMLLDQSSNSNSQQPSNVLELLTHTSSSSSSVSSISRSSFSSVFFSSPSASSSTSSSIPSTSFISSFSSHSPSSSSLSSSLFSFGSPSSASNSILSTSSSSSSSSSCTRKSGRHHFPVRKIKQITQCSALPISSSSLLVSSASSVSFLSSSSSTKGLRTGDDSMDTSFARSKSDQVQM